MSLTHLDEHSRSRMVDVGEKVTTRRVAVAEGWVVFHRMCMPKSKRPMAKPPKAQ